MVDRKVTFNLADVNNKPYESGAIVARATEEYDTASYRVLTEAKRIPLTNSPLAFANFPAGAVIHFTQPDGSSYFKLIPDTDVNYTALVTVVPVVDPPGYLADTLIDAVISDETSDAYATLEQFVIDHPGPTGPTGATGATGAAGGSDTSFASFVTDPTKLTAQAVTANMRAGLVPVATSIATTAGALALNKHNPVDATTAPVTMTLPDATVAGRIVSVEKTDATANTVTISGNLRGSAGTIALAYQRETLLLSSKADGSWWPVSGHRTKSSIDTQISADVTALLASDPSVLSALASQIASIAPSSAFSTADSKIYNFPSNTANVTARGTASSVIPGTMTTAANFNGATTSTGGATITVRGPGSPTYGNTLNAGFMQATGGTGAAYMLWQVPNAFEGSARAVIGSKSANATSKGFGVVTACKIDGTAVAFLMTNLSTATGAYVVQRYVSIGTNGFNSGTITTLVPENGLAVGRTAQPGDVVDLSMDATGLILLVVNGDLVATYRLTAAQLSAHVGATGARYVGTWGTVANSASNYLGNADWQSSVVTGTELRKSVTVGDSLSLPDAMLGTPAMRRDTGIYDIRDYGAKCDGILLTDAVTVASQPTVSSASYSFTAADVGKTIAVRGAGPVLTNANDGVWSSTILSVTSGVATLASNATSTVSAASCIFGTPDDLAVAKAQIAANSISPYLTRGGTVFFPAGRRTIVTKSLTVLNNVQFAGAGREVSLVYVVKDNGDWLNATNYTISAPLTGTSYHDFAIVAWAHTCSAGYQASTKPLNIFKHKRTEVYRMSVYDTPATSIPFDQAQSYCVIRDNFISNPGRLAPSGVGPGGSGIGVGTNGTDNVEAMVITGNVIIGTHDATTAGAGNNGIFLETQTGALPDNGTTGYRIHNNVVVGMPNGIADDGSTGSIISGNIMVSCGRGITLNAGTVTAGYPGRDTQIFGNTIYKSNGPGSNDGIGIEVTTRYGASRPNINSKIRSQIHDNAVLSCNASGIVLTVQDVMIDGVSLYANSIRDCGLSGIKVSKVSGGATSTLRQLVIRDNQISSNGRNGVSGDQSGVLIASGMTILGGRIQDNDIYDLESSPTQLATYTTTGATLTSVRIAGNTGDA